MEVVIEILADAEKAGIVTGGKDRKGNYAYVVIDSSSLITIIVRPTGRATLVVNGESTDFDLQDEEGQGMAELFTNIAQSLQDDNLDDKSQRLLDIMQSGVEDDSEDEEDDSEESEDSEEEEDDSEEDTSGDVDQLDDSDEEDSEEEASTEDNELALMVDFREDIIKDMIESAADNPTPFYIEQFSHILGINNKNENAGGKSAVFYTGMSLGVDTQGRRLNVSAYYGTGKAGASKEFQKSGKRGADVVAEYATMLKRFAKSNGQDFTKTLKLLDALKTEIASNADISKIRETCAEIAKQSSDASHITKNGRQFVFEQPVVAYTIGYEINNNNPEVYVRAKSQGRERQLARFKADYMVTVAAGFAELASKLGGASAPRGLLYKGTNRDFSLVLMKMATNLGYEGKTVAQTKVFAEGVELNA